MLKIVKSENRVKIVCIFAQRKKLKIHIWKSLEKLYN